jgi:nitrogen-specific signal transduction histidine kinase/ActR/RegA family two-component response regulator
VRKQAEASLRQSQKMEALGTLAGGIAHDFNNILTAILGNVTFAMDALPPDHAVQRRLATVERATLRAADLVRRILTFSRRQVTVPRVSDLAPIVEEAVQLLRSTLPAMIAIRCTAPPGLPPVSVETTQVHQVVMNLAGNALHAMRERGGTLEFRLETVTVGAGEAGRAPDLREGPYVRLSVSDTGGGMDQATLARVFDPFFTTKAPGEGTGLGLSVVHGIMKTHGGAITTASEPGLGTTFQLYFPVATPDSEAVALEGAAAEGGGARVLYIDDEEAVIALGTEMLQGLSYRVTSCTTPAEAIEIFRVRPRDFDAVVTDLAMPGMSGLELTRELRAIRPDVPVVLCTGYIADDDARAAQSLGIRDIVLKPYTAPDLGQALSRTFRQPTT